MNRTTQKRGVTVLAGVMALGLGQSLVPAAHAATAAGAVFNNLSLSTALNADPTSAADTDDSTTVHTGDRLYLGSSSDPKKLSGWLTMPDGSKKAFTPSDYTLTTKADHEYSLAFKATSLTITVEQSANVPSLYIKTTNGVKTIEAKKGNTDSGTMSLIGSDGNPIYSDKLSEMKGHGNTTWAYAKKAYSIKLPKAKELVPGAGAAKTWLLLANWLDGSNVRNELSYNMEGAVLQRAGATDYSIQGRMVDLYVNGEYRGAYYLCEKVQVNGSRINITDTDGLNDDANPGVDVSTLATTKFGASNSPTPGLKEGKYVSGVNNAADYQNDGYLLSLDFNDESTGASGESSYFVTRRGTPIAVATPEYASKDELAFASSRVQGFEDALFSPDGKNADGKTWQDYVDVDSLARYYAMEELFANDDGFKSSMYMYMDKGGKLSFSPVWDNDRALGSTNTSPTGLYVGSPTRLKTQWIKQLLSKQEFRSAVSNQFSSYVKPEANAILASKLGAYAAEVNYSSRMDKLRWPTANRVNWAKYSPTPSGDIDTLRSFLSTRLANLSNIFGGTGYQKNTSLADGVYKITNGKLALDVPSSSKTSKVGLQVYSDNGSNAQRYKLMRGTDGYYTIINVNSGLAMDVSGSSLTPGTTVDQATPNGSLAQKWIVSSTDGTNFTIASALGTAPIEVRSGPETGVALNANGTTSGSKLTIAKPTGASNQLFQFTLASASTSTGSGSTGTGATTGSTSTGSTTTTPSNMGSLVTNPVAGKTYTIVSALNKNMVVEAQGGSSANKTNIVLYTYNASKAQQFTLTAGPNGTYILKTGPGGVMDVANSGKTPGTNVDQYAANGTAAQQWILKPTGDGDGSFYIVAKVNNLNLDVKNSSTANNTNIQTYTPNNSTAQKFYFYAK